MNTYQLFEKFIEFAHNQLKTYQDTKDLNDTFLMVMGSLYRKTIELSEGVKVSVINGLQGPTDINTRSLLEAHLAFKYILQKPHLARERAVAYRIGYHKQQIEVAEKSLNKEPQEYLKEAIKYHTKIIQKQEFQKVLTEYNRLHFKDPINNKKKHIPKWHSLYGGPKSINLLAEKVTEKGVDPKLVRMIYGSLSSDAHNYLALRDIFEAADSKITIKPIKQAMKLDSLTLPRALLISTIKDFTLDVYPESKDIFIRLAQEVEPYLT